MSDAAHVCQWMPAFVYVYNMCIAHLRTGLLLIATRESKECTEVQETDVSTVSVVQTDWRETVFSSHSR